MKKRPKTQKDPRVMLELLESVHRDGKGSQRERASEFGVALGLVNAYLNYCVKKGYVRVKKIPTQRYSYFLTPKGFTEKSRLALALISSSFRSFRQARQDYTAAFQTFKAAGFTRVVLMGMSELAEVSLICAAESDVEIVGIIQPGTADEWFGKVPINASFEDVPGGFDAVIITDLMNPQASFTEAVHLLGHARVQAPPILGIRPLPRETSGEAAEL
jgi:hypothetical protein